VARKYLPVREIDSNGVEASSVSGNSGGHWLYNHGQEFVEVENTDPDASHTLYIPTPPPNEDRKVIIPASGKKLVGRFPPAYFNHGASSARELHLDYATGAEDSFVVSAYKFRPVS